MARAGEAPPSADAGGLLAPPPPLAAVLEPRGGSGDQKSRCNEPGQEKPETPAVTKHHKRGQRRINDRNETNKL